MSDATEPFLFWREENVAHFLFNRPAVLNAIDVATADAFLAACRAVATDPAVRVVVMSGKGRAFVSGGDLGLFRKNALDGATGLIDRIHAGVALLAALPAPVVASLHGVVAGAGLSLALAADLAIAAEGTRFNLAYVNIGASCDAGASWSLPRIVGLRKALEIALLGETFTAEDALGLGLVNRVVPVDALEHETQKLARRIAAGPPIAVSRIKRLMRDSFARDLPSQLDAERDAFRECVVTSDFGEGLEAFFGKRPAQFVGR
jgi:2-(1,2-epoxy-1,2-dihydrophenyl)acetyl-CoA isomerase